MLPAPADARWSRVRLWAGHIAAWYLPLIYRFRPVEVPGLRVRLRRDWTLEVGNGLDDTEVLALVVELCDHLERDHLGRRGDRDPAVWSHAAGCESVGAWEDLLGGEMGRLPGGLRARFPRDAPSPRRLGLPPNLRAEAYYELLADDSEDALALFGPYGPPAGSPRRHEPEPGRGIPAPGRAPSGEGDGDPLPDDESGDARAIEPQERPVAGVDLAGSEAPDRDELEAIVREVEAEMRRAAAGSLPAEVERHIRRGAPPQIAWRHELARSVGRLGGRDDFSILPRPNYARLVATGALGSRLQTGRPRVTVLRDSSASMDAGLLAQVLAEVEELERHTAELQVVDADTRVHRVRRGDARDLNRIVGGGGTDMLGAAWEAWRATRPDRLVVLTDGQTPWDELSQEPPATTWVIVGREAAYVPRRFRSVIWLPC